MAEVVVAPSFVGRVRNYATEVVAEMRRVTWPDKVQVRQLSIGVVALSLFVGAVISLIDVILNAVLVRGLPSLLGG